MPMTTNTSELPWIFLAAALMRANSSLSYAVGRLTQPKKSLPMPVLDMSSWWAVSTWGAMASYSCWETKPLR